MGSQNRVTLIKFMTPCNDIQVMGPYLVSSPHCLTILTSRAEDYTTAPQHLHYLIAKSSLTLPQHDKQFCIDFYPISDPVCKASSHKFKMTSVNILMHVWKKYLYFFVFFTLSCEKGARSFWQNIMNVNSANWALIKRSPQRRWIIAE